MDPWMLPTLMTTSHQLQDVVPMHYGTQGCPGYPPEMRAAMKREDVNFLVVEPGQFYSL